MIDFTITLTGTTGLLMHNSRLSDPLDPVTKELKKLSGKQRKTEEDHEAMAQIEHAGGLYIDPDIGPYLPADNIHKCLFKGAARFKLGPRITTGIIISTDVNPLAYKGPRTIEALWADEQFRFRHSVVVDRKRIMRTRPLFPTWTCAADGILDPSELEFDDLVRIAENAGSLVGIGDWRPEKGGRFGRFTATVEQAAKTKTTKRRAA